jgi:hypothetical protein
VESHPLFPVVDPICHLERRRADIAAQSTIMIRTSVPMDFSCCDLLNDHARPKVLS